MSTKIGDPDVVAVGIGLASGQVAAGPRADLSRSNGLADALDHGAAVGLPVGEPASAVVVASQDGGSGLLGKREEDVARLVADGLSNKQIGARLFISERTVESHVRSILNKLGFNSRAQIAAWIASPDN